MSIELHDRNALILAARNAGKPLAFLVGAPLSIDSDGGVPNVAGMVALIREEVRTRIPDALDEFDAEVSKAHVGGAKYQAAMKWLKGTLLPDTVNSVVEKGVLKARKPGAPADFEDDIDEYGLGNWHLPLGTQHLGRLVATNGRQFPGPILTTNFDPLLSVAIEVSKGHARWHVEDDRCSIGHSLRARPGHVDVIHLHGYWRRSDTLHTHSQLTAERHSLTFALQSILRQKTLVVVAYGGWDDVFTNALESLLKYGAPEDRMAVNVLWCFREDDPIEIERLYGNLLQRMASSRFIAYKGIDCHSVFAEIGGFSGTVSDAERDQILAPIAGWEVVDISYLEELPTLKPADILNYFDGSVPTWPHAVSPAIPRRQDTGKIVTRLAQFTAGASGCSMQLVRAAGGEGKTTLILQAACDAVREGKWTVLWRPSALVSLPPQHVLGLDPGKMWLIVADDADNLVEEIAVSARLLREAGRSNVHFLVASRDTDWISKFGDEPSWESWLTAWVRRNQAITLRGITRDDANAIVEAWGKFGAEGLKELATVSGHTAQVDALVEQVRHEEHTQGARFGRRLTFEGSFFGGLLSVRFGQEGLQAHVRRLLARLREERIEKSQHTLFDALVYVAACHAGGIPGLDEHVLADLVEVPRDWVQDLVVRRLGEEACGVFSGGHVFTRHRKVADAILAEADRLVEGERMADLAEVWRVIVQQTVRTSREVEVGHCFPAIVHSGPRLMDELPGMLSDARRIEIAFSAARAAVEHKREWLGCITSLGKTYRVAGLPGDASAMFRRNLAAVRSKRDYFSHIRGYWHEWGVSEGLLADDQGFRAADVWIQALSLSDYPGSVAITQEQAKQSLSSLAVAFGLLAQPVANCPFNIGRRAAAHLGNLTNPDPDTSETFRRMIQEASRAGVPEPRDSEEAMNSLSIAVFQAANELLDPFLKNLATPEQTSFDQLRRFFQLVAPKSLISVERHEIVERDRPQPAPRDLRYEVWKLIRNMLALADSEQRHLYLPAVGLELGRSFPEAKPVYRHLGFETLTDLILSFGDFAVTGEHPKWKVSFRDDEKLPEEEDLRYEVWNIVGELIDRSIANQRPLYLPTIGIELSRRFPGTIPTHRNLGFETLTDLVISFGDFVITGEHPKWQVQYREDDNAPAGGDLRERVAAVIGDLIDKSIVAKRALPLPVVGLELARAFPEARPVHSYLGFASLSELINSFETFIVVGDHPLLVAEYRKVERTTDLENLRDDVQVVLASLIDRSISEQRPLYLPTVGNVLKQRFPDAHPIYHALGFGALTDMITSFDEFAISGEHPRWMVHYRDVSEGPPPMPL